MRSYRVCTHVSVKLVNMVGRQYEELEKQTNFVFGNENPLPLK